MSYASQDPWLFIDTVRNNILFGQAFNSEKYKTVKIFSTKLCMFQACKYEAISDWLFFKFILKVVKISALSEDFKQFPHGDKTLVGERGISLSGGQKARISLARTLYKEARKKFELMYKHVVIS